MRKKKKIVKPSEMKIMFLLKELNEKELFPISEGVYKILNGVMDQETVNLQSLKSFGSLISYSHKKITRFITHLMKIGFVINIYDNNTKSLYLKLSMDGEEYLNNNPIPSLKTKTKRSKPTIVNIKQ